MKNLAIAVDLGATNLRVALISNKGKILKKVQTKTPKTGKSNKIIAREIIELIKILLKEDYKKRIKGIGISAAGPIDFKKGELIHPPNIPFKRVPVIKPLKKEFLFPVFLYNDCSSAVWGEKHFGAAKIYKNIVYITISSGIGGGVIVDNHLLFGRSGNAAEIGHFIVDTKYNFPCGCKKGTGHWEGYSSGNNLPRFFNYWLKFHKINKVYSIKKAKDIFDLARNSDKIVLKFLEEIGQINGRGVSNVIVAYDPEIIILGGAVVLNNRKIILSYLKNNIDKFLPLPKIIVTPLQEDVSLFGAAALVFWPPK